MPTRSTSPAPHPHDSFNPLRVRELLFHHFGLTMGTIHSLIRLSVSPYGKDRVIGNEEHAYSPCGWVGIQNGNDPRHNLVKRG